jgi:hypothetical protein
MTPKHLILLFVAATILGCASTSEDAAKTEERLYADSARSHELSAKEWHDSGIDTMATYHQKKATEARHNELAAGCGWIEWFLTAIALDLDACDRKVNH